MDPYAVLGVPRNATPRQVARAHRRLAKRYHPDLHPDPEATRRMQRINEAWRILSGSFRRARDGAGSRPRGSSHGHWAASQRVVRPTPRPSTQTWATRGATPPRTGRAARPRPEHHSFRDTGWAALLVGATFVLLLILGTHLGR